MSDGHCSCPFRGPLRADKAAVEIMDPDGRTLDLLALLYEDDVGGGHRGAPDLSGRDHMRPNEAA